MHYYNHEQISLINQRVAKGKKGGKTRVGWQRLKSNGVSPFHKKGRISLCSEIVCMYCISAETIQGRKLFAEIR